MNAKKAWEKWWKNTPSKVLKNPNQPIEKAFTAGYHTRELERLEQDRKACKYCRQDLSEFDVAYTVEEEPYLDWAGNYLHRSHKASHGYAKCEVGVIMEKIAKVKRLLP